MLHKHNIAQCQRGLTREALLNEKTPDKEPRFETISKQVLILQTDKGRTLDPSSQASLLEQRNLMK